MHPTISPTRLAATLLTLTLLACGDSADGDEENAFCASMEQVATRMVPNTGPTPPGEVEANFDEVVTLRGRAQPSSAITWECPAFSWTSPASSMGIPAAGLGPTCVPSASARGELIEGIEHLRSAPQTVALPVRELDEHAGLDECPKQPIGVLGRDAELVSK